MIAKPKSYEKTPLTHWPSLGACFSFGVSPWRATSVGLVSFIALSPFDSAWGATCSIGESYVSSTKLNTTDNFKHVHGAHIQPMKKEGHRLLRSLKIDIGGLCQIVFEYKHLLLQLPPRPNDLNLDPRKKTNTMIRVKLSVIRVKETCYSNHIHKTKT